MNRERKADLLQNRELGYESGDVALVRQVAAENGTDESGCEEDEESAPSDGGSHEELTGSDGDVLVV